MLQISEVQTMTTIVDMITQETHEIDEHGSSSGSISLRHYRLFHSSLTRSESGRAAVRVRPYIRTPLYFRSSVQVPEGVQLTTR